MNWKGILIAVVVAVVAGILVELIKHKLNKKTS